MSVVHSFRDSLALSNQHAEEPFWEEVYRKAFPTMQSTHLIRKDGWAQRAGIDRVVLLAGGRTVHIEQKVRRDVWPDIALEYWSQYENKKLGWIELDSATDYLAYAFLPTRQCFFFDYLSLRRAWKHHKYEWLELARSNRDGFKTVSTLNQHYTTWSLAVPITRLVNAITAHMCIEWGQS